MSFLVRPDFYTSIQSTDLDIISSSDDNILNDAINTAEIFLKSYISDRYDVDAIFFSVLLYNYDVPYVTGNKIVLLADEFVSGRSYVVGNLVNDPATGFVYRAIQNGTNQPLSNSLYWTLFGENKAVYECISPATNKRPNETAYFTKRNSRNALIVRLMVDLVIYDIHSRLSPRNIPEHRVQRRDDVVKYLKDVANPRSNINPDFPLKTMDEGTGLDISYGKSENLNAY